MIHTPVAKGFPGLATQAIGVVQGPHFIDEAMAAMAFTRALMRRLMTCCQSRPMATKSSRGGPSQAGRWGCPSAAARSTRWCGGGRWHGCDRHLRGLLFNLPRSASDMASNAARKAGRSPRGHPCRRASSARTGWSQPRWAIVRLSGGNLGLGSFQPIGDGVVVRWITKSNNSWGGGPLGVVWRFRCPCPGRSA